MVMMVFFFMGVFMFRVMMVDPGGLLVFGDTRGGDNVEFGRGNRGTQDLFHRQPVAGNCQPGQAVFQYFQVSPGVQQRADDHITAGPRKTIEICYACHTIPFGFLFAVLR